MTATLRVAADLLREAASRRWFLALGGAITLVLFGLGGALKMEVVDGALAATKLFGFLLDHDIQAADVALRPVFQATAYLVFYGGLAFGILACADFGPSLLSPGRIEHLLSLPVRRWELLLGTFLGVLALASFGALYGAGGVTVILSVKTSTFTWKPLVAALLGSCTFAAIYAAMLAAALFVRSAALSAAVGGMLLVAGIVAGYRADIAPAFEPGAGRTAFEVASLVVPRVSALADAGAALAGSQPVDLAVLGKLVLGLVAFAAAMLAIGVFRFEQKDF